MANLKKRHPSSRNDDLINEVISALKVAQNTGKVLYTAQN